MTIQGIKAYLKENKITYSELSAKSGIHISTLNYIFTRRTANPRTDTMRAIESALGVDNSNVVAPDRPELNKIIDKCKQLNDRGLIVMDCVASLLKDHPEYCIQNKSETG